MQRTNTSTTRRHFLTGAATSVAVWQLAAAADGQPPKLAPPDKGGKTGPAKKSLTKREHPVIAISSYNGLEATRKAYELLLKGADTLDACVEGVTIVEDDPNDNTVGYGGMPNEEGEVELDAAVMHGPTHSAGAVAALKKIKNPAKVARLVMKQTDHVLLVGKGAAKFAKAQGFKEEELLTEKARKIWLYWRQTHSGEDDWLPPPDKDLDPDVAKYFGRPTGTVHVAAMNAKGEISCVTSTSGLAFKLPGRVGDSPIIGAGLYVDNAIGSCGSTGRGEANLQNLSSFAAVELMRGGMPPQEAGLEILRRVAASTVPRLRDKKGRPLFQLKFYLLAKDGRPASVSMWAKADGIESQFAITDRNGSRLEKSTALFPEELPAK
jgi:N4-(beta-N-acetylglucosaminyl)-L-asparaginase